MDLCRGCARPGPQVKKGAHRVFVFIIVVVFILDHLCFTVRVINLNLDTLVIVQIQLRSIMMRSKSSPISVGRIPNPRAQKKFFRDLYCQYTQYTNY